MPRGLTLSQRLTGPDGLPTAAARIGVVALMAIAGAAGYAAGPDGEAPATRGAAPVAISRLSGDLPIATPEARPALRTAAALPAIRDPARRRPARRSAPAEASAEATPAPSATPAASATPAPAAAEPVPVATPAPPAPAAQPAPRRSPPPTETFDSSG